MGSSNGKQQGEKRDNKKRLSFKKVLRFQSRRSTSPSRPVSYAGINNQHHEEHERSTRPLSMYDEVPFDDLERSKNIYFIRQKTFLINYRNINERF